LVGYNDGGTISDSYYDSNTSGQSDDDGRGVPKTTAQMMDPDTFTGWDFTDTWEITEGATRPSLQSGDTPTSALDTSFISAIVTKTNIVNTVNSDTVTTLQSRARSRRFMLSRRGRYFRFRARQQRVQDVAPKEIVPVAEVGTDEQDDASTAGDVVKEKADAAPAGYEQEYDNDSLWAGLVTRSDIDSIKRALVDSVETR